MTLFSLTVVRCRCFLASSSGKRTPLTPTGAISCRALEGAYPLKNILNQSGHSNKTEEQSKGCGIKLLGVQAFSNLSDHNRFALVNHQLFEGHPLPNMDIGLVSSWTCPYLLGSLHSHQSPNTWLYLGCPAEKKNYQNYTSHIYLVGRCRKQEHLIFPPHDHMPMLVLALQAFLELVEFVLQFLRIWCQATLRCL